MAAPASRHLGEPLTQALVFSHLVPATREPGQDRKLNRLPPLVRYGKRSYRFQRSVEGMFPPPPFGQPHFGTVGYRSEKERLTYSFHHDDHTLLSAISLWSCSLRISN